MAVRVVLYPQIRLASTKLCEHDLCLEARAHSVRAAAERLRRVRARVRALIATDDALKHAIDTDAREDDADHATEEGTHPPRSPENCQRVPQYTTSCVLFNGALGAIARTVANVTGAGGSVLSPGRHSAGAPRTAAAAARLVCLASYSLYLNPASQTPCQSFYSVSTYSGEAIK